MSEKQKEIWCDCEGRYTTSQTCAMCPTEAEIDAAKEALQEYEENGGKSLEQILAEIQAAIT